MQSDEPAASEPPEEVSVADQLMRRIEEAKGLRETLLKINTDFSGEMPIYDEEVPFVLDEPAEAPQQTSPAPAEIQEPQPIVPMQEQASAEPPDPLPPPDETPPAPSPAAENGGTVSQGSDLVFEPYHTIDYFASQGIRLTLDENPGDKLGKQMKSFTDWLKVMRRLPQKDRESIPDRVAEQAVQNFAAHSIESRDVVTETMAEVLVKQGMRDRARAIYEKLSLLNPDKRAYFAGKIEQLNIP